MTSLQDWIAFEELHGPLFREHGAIYFSNSKKPSRDFNYAFCEVSRSLFCSRVCYVLHPHLQPITFSCAAAAWVLGDPRASLRSRLLLRLHLRMHTPMHTPMRMLQSFVIRAWIDYECSTWIAKFTPVTAIGFLLNKICNWGSSKVPFLKAATLSVWIWAYPRETKTNNGNFKNATISPSKIAHAWRACALILPLCQRMQTRTYAYAY